MADERIELSQLLRYVSKELHDANAKAAAEGSAVMQFDECKLEFAVAAEKHAGGGIKVWVLNLGGGAKKSESHTITITMKAIPGKAIVAPAQGPSSRDDMPFARQTNPGGKSK